MKIVVLGGPELIGSKVLNRLRQLGQNVLSATPDSGVNAVTGDGLAHALSGAQVVVDVANSPPSERKAGLSFFEEASRRNLLAAEADAGVGHHVALSVVGTDRLTASCYFRGKMQQESLISASAIPYTIVRSTQPFELLERIAESATVGRIIRLSPALVQPIAAEDVAAAVADVALGAPVNGVVEIGGPEQMRLSDIVKRYLDAFPDGRVVVADARARYFGVELDDRSLVPEEKPRVGAMGFREWAGRRVAAEVDLTYP